MKISKETASNLKRIKMSLEEAGRLLEIESLLTERANEGYTQGYKSGEIPWGEKARAEVKKLHWYKRLTNQF